MNSSAGRAPLAAVLGNRTAGNHAMHVEVVSQLLVPRVQHHGETDLAAEVVVTECQERVGDGAKQQVQQRAPVALAGQQQRIQLVWQRKHVVKIRRRQQFRLAILQPGRLGKRLALGAIAVTAAVVFSYAKVIKHSLKEVVLAFEEHTVECAGSL